MSAAPANLQRLTRKQAAAIMNVSERGVAMACYVRQRGEPALCEAIEGGRMTMHIAYRAARYLARDVQRTLASLEPRKQREAMRLLFPKAKDVCPSCGETL